GFRKFTKNNLSILFLSNGYKYFPVHDLIINHLAGLVDSNLLNPESLVKETIQSDFILLPIQQALLNYQDIRKQNPNLDLEGILNSLGYALMKEDRVKDAIEVLAINVEENPNSSNVYDSFAEAYFKNRQYEQSLKYYKKSLELDPTNNNAVAMIEEINQHMSNKK
nr:tetratricopeptide repeat protein [Saprospiraceae bacterium]